MKFFKHIIVLFLCIMMLFPFLFVLIGASHDSSWAFQSSLDLSWGKDFIRNFLTLKNKYSVGRVLFNSFSSSFLTAGFSVIVMELAAYSVCKFNFKGKQILWSLIIALSIVPQPTYLVGQIETINRLGMYSTFIGLVIPFIINLKILIYLRNINQFIPNEILNAARLDGASELQIFFRIVLPLIYPNIIVFFTAGIAGIFTNQLNLYSFYGQDAQLEYYTFGYYLYRNTQIDATGSNYGYLAAIGVMLTLVVAPITFAVRSLLIKFGPSSD